MTTLLRPSALNIFRENAQATLYEALDHLRQSDARAAAGHAHVEAAVSYRRLAVCALLGEARADHFATYLRKSAQVGIHLLQRIQTGMDTDVRYRCASRCFYFVDALAGGDLVAAETLASLAPGTWMPQVEYKDDFLRHHVWHQLVLHHLADDKVDLSNLLDRWTEVLEGAADPYLEVSRSLVERNTKMFNDQLSRLIETRQGTFDELRARHGPYNDVSLSEQFVFMNGLALLRLAALANMSVEIAYVSLPAIAHVPLVTSPLAADAWRIPESGIIR